MGLRTPLYAAHLAAGGTLVDFAGWDMPVHYGSQVAEHHAVRSAAGVFDVSHMRIVDIGGPGAEPMLRRVLANDVARLAADQALYSVMCNESGGVIDDVIVYRTQAGYRIVVNCATTDKDLAWLSSQAGPGDPCRIEPREDLAMLAVQGPQARARAGEALPQLASVLDGLETFHSSTSGDFFVARTGYTGEDGVEIMLPAEAAVGVWDALLAAGVQPAGLGARDTLRLEAGLNLYGSEMDDSVSPLQCGLAWTVAWEPQDRAFIGRPALEEQRGSLDTRFVGLILTGRGIMRAHQEVRTDQGDGIITSGTFSPTMGVSLALARIPAGDASTAQVQIRGKLVDADIVRPPFVRNGRSRYSTPGGADA